MFINHINVIPACRESFFNIYQEKIPDRAYRQAGKPE
jgi:hypothetical protein